MPIRCGRSGLSQRGETQRVITGLNLGAAPSNVANDSMETAAGASESSPLSDVSRGHVPVSPHGPGRSHAGAEGGEGGGTGAPVASRPAWRRTGDRKSVV